ncbi:MAG: PepSY-like domain-containing protein [Alistipes sp.]|nr:PepSY-like domain-containing protein [Alistipes sp.]
MRKLMFAAIAAVVALALYACDNYDAPTSLRNAFYDKYPTAVDVEWEKKRGYAVADFTLPGQGECEAWYTKGGEWVMTKYDIKYSELPQAVRQAFESEYGAQTPVDDVERVERNTGDVIYFIEATIVVNGYLTDIYLDYAPDGTLLRTAVDVEDYDGIYYYLP